MLCLESGETLKYELADNQQKEVCTTKVHIKKKKNWPENEFVVVVF